MSGIMAISRPVRIPEELHEEAETVALIMSHKAQKIIEKNEVIKEALSLGLKELKKKHKKG